MLELTVDGPRSLAHARVIIAVITNRDWEGLVRWANLGTDERREHTRTGARPMAVPSFDHSSQQPLIALLVKEGSTTITLIAAANRGRYEAAADLSRLMLHDAVALPVRSPISAIDKLRDRVSVVSPRNRRYFTDEIVRTGGLLPPVLSQTIIADIRERHPELITRLAASFPTEANSLNEVDARRRFVFQQQRDAALLAFRIVGIEDVDQLRLREQPSVLHSFLDQLPQRRVSEEQLLRADALNFPGMTALRDANIDRQRFTSGNRRLDLIFAHRERLEELTGADFIYYNATFGSFVLVQYKLLEEAGDREIYRINQHMRDQMSQMRASAPLPMPPPDDAAPGAFRLGHEACFWKFVSRQADLEADQALIPGYYLPLSLLQKSVQLGARGGELIAPAELPRSLSNTAFATLVRDAWVGTTGAQTTALQQLITSILSDHRGLTLAIHAAESSPTP